MLENENSNGKIKIHPRRGKEENWGTRNEWDGEHILKVFLEVRGKRNEENKVVGEANEYGK